MGSGEIHLHGRSRQNGLPRFEGFKTFFFGLIIFFQYDSQNGLPRFEGFKTLNELNFYPLWFCESEWIAPL